MLLDPNDGRLAKTIRLLDSPVAGERSAALEAACRQLETLGLCWADVAPKFGTFVSDRGGGAAHGRAMAAEKLLLNTCRWNGCSGHLLRGSPFCEAHVAEIISEPLGNFMSFLRNLPVVVGADIAGDALYHAIHAAAHIGMFDRHLRHDLIRATSASRDGNGIEATIEKLVAAIGPPERGEFLMHLKRQLVVPERRVARRDVID
jgi:hypothetical protein